VTQHQPQARIRGWRWLAAALVVGAAAGSALGLVHSGPRTATFTPPPSAANATWAAGARRAPDFRLTDQHGAPISLRLFHGRPVILTFIDPACTTLCPLEAKVLDRVAAHTPRAERPVIVAVSVNPWAESQATFRQDARKWRLATAWHWAVGPYSQLSPVWKRYDIGVRARKRVVGGRAIHDVSHTEASFLVDAAGYERALFVYPFRAADVAKALQHLHAT
jgi:cytochrome oxidase Cu insertion factor (SCO1/SenC/PrrC family)